MEFGIFIQHPVFAHHREGNPDYEHQVIMNEIALVEAADRPASSTCGSPSTTSSTSTRTCRPTT